MTDEVRNQLNKLGEIANQISDLINNGEPFGNTEKQATGQALKIHFLAQNI